MLSIIVAEEVAIVVAVAKRVEEGADDVLLFEQGGVAPQRCSLNVEWSRGSA
jgi:hypothetical protein